MKVLIADAHPTALAGIRHALENAGMQVVAEETNGPDAVLAATRTKPDIALLDVSMPDSIEAARQIVHDTETSVVMLSGVACNEDLFAALSAGARGFLLKDMDPSRLPLALEGVMRGEAAIPRTLVTHLIDEFRRREATHRPLIGPSGQQLTRREQEVLQLTADGLSTHQLAEEFGISRVTVRRHLSNLVEKLNVIDRAEAVTTYRRAEVRA